MRSLSEFVCGFLDCYMYIPKFFKKIFGFLQALAKKWGNVFPCIETICKAVGCSDRTAKRATKYFHELGWVCKKKRGYQSNFYFMHHELIDLDLDNPVFFERKMSPSCPSSDPKVAPYCNTSYGPTSLSTSDRSSHIKNQEGKKVPHILKEFFNPSNRNPQPLNEQQALLLAKEFSEYQLQQACDDAKWYMKAGNTIKMAFAVIRSRAWNIKRA